MKKFGPCKLAPNKSVDDVRKESAKVTEPEEDFPPFGVDPADSAALLKLRSAIDDADMWPSVPVKESGDYEAAVKFMVSLIRERAANEKSFRRKAHNQRTELNRMERALRLTRSELAQATDGERGAAAVAADAVADVSRLEARLRDLTAERDALRNALTQLMVTGSFGRGTLMWQGAIKQAEDALRSQPSPTREEKDSDSELIRPGAFGTGPNPQSDVAPVVENTGRFDDVVTHERALLLACQLHPTAAQNQEKRRYVLQQQARDADVQKEAPASEAPRPTQGEAVGVASVGQADGLARRPRDGGSADAPSAEPTRGPAGRSGDCGATDATGETVATSATVEAKPAERAVLAKPHVDGLHEDCLCAGCRALRRQRYGKEADGALESAIREKAAAIFGNTQPAQKPAFVVGSFVKLRHQLDSARWEIAETRTMLPSNRQHRFVSESTWWDEYRLEPCAPPDDPAPPSPVELPGGMGTVSPIPMWLTCPVCMSRHIDEGEFATKPHHTHSCQTCGLTWRPAVVPTVGVAFLPGFKNEVESA